MLVSMLSFLRLDPKTNATTAPEAFEAQNNEEPPVPSAPPMIQDFYVNSTLAGQTSLFSFNVTDSSGTLDYAVFGCNITGSFTNDPLLSLNGSQAWVNVTKILPAYNYTLAFQFWCWNTNATIFTTTGLRVMKVYVYTSGGWNTPFNCLGDALVAIDSTNDWNSVDNYSQVILGHQNVSALSAMIDNYDSAHDWIDVLAMSAVCNKLNITRQQAIIDALNNYTMVGSLPYTDSHSGAPDFSVDYKWALYGYYYANQSWANTTPVLAKWNVTAAYQQFTNSVYNLGRPPMWILANGVALPFTTRYYDECASTIECYIIFYELLNVTGALNDALHWWDYTNTNLWSSWGGGYYRYNVAPSDPAYECEAPFFLKIISILKYYDMPLQNWTNVLTDIGNRFLKNEWNSYQWLDISGTTTHVVVHEYQGNPQRRLINTLGAWQALEGTYLAFNDSYESKMRDMLYGNQATEPAWALLLRPEAGLFDSATNMFRYVTDYPDDSHATAWAETLLFLMGIIPHSTTIAFPLEELNYEYVYDIDPVILNLDTALRQVTVPVYIPGDLTFQYGVSPLTISFSQSGVWQITFTDSWNNVANVTFQSALPNNLIYFSQMYAESLCSSLGTSGNLAGRSCLFSAHWIDRAQNANVSGFIFGCNNTGTWVNETWSSDQNLGWGTSSAWGNITKTLNYTGNAVIQWQEWANDSYGIWGTTGLQTLQTLPIPSVSPSVNDFYVNSTWAGQPCLFSFNVSDSSNQLDHAIFGCNVTGTFTNDANTWLSGGSSWQWVNYTKALPSSNSIVSFSFSVWNTNTTISNTTGLRLLKVYTYNSTSGAWNTPFVSLGSAMQTVEGANNWTGVDPYYTTVLNQQNGSASTYLSNMIDSFDNRVTVGEANVTCSYSAGDSWVNPQCANDSNTATCTYQTIGASNSTFLTLNLTDPVLGSKISFWANVSWGTVSKVYVDVANQTGSFLNVYAGSPSWNTWFNASFSNSNYSAMRFSFDSKSSATLDLCEIMAINASLSYCASVNSIQILYWSAICNKLGITRQQAIIDALNNYEMIGALPYTLTVNYGNYAGTDSFSPENKWALYGYYYASQSWASQYVNQSQWNVTAAYQAFNQSIYNAGNPVMSIMYGSIPTPSYYVDTYWHVNGTYDPRYYDECGCTIDCYLLFYSLLGFNGTDGTPNAMNDALYWWNWTNNRLWSTNATYGGYYKYISQQSDPSFECESGFFLKVIGLLKYYNSSISNWDNVMTNIGTRFLSNEWNSYQWEISPNNSTYAVVHEALGLNNQTRLTNTLGAWQAMEGMYLQLNSTYEQNIVDMLYGNQATEPAWALLLTPQAGLFNSTANMFSYSNTVGAYTFANDPNATTVGEILLFMMGIVPQTTAVAFPLEELSYEYIKDIDPTTLNMNVSTRTLTAPVSSAGTLTFQYGVSPITQQFNSSGVYQIVFSGSWNNIVGVNFVSSLPSNAIYFSQLNAPTAAEPTNGGGGRPAYVC